MVSLGQKYNFRWAYVLANQQISYDDFMQSDLNENNWDCKEAFLNFQVLTDSNFTENRSGNMICMISALKQWYSKKQSTVGKTVYGA